MGMDRNAFASSLRMGEGPEAVDPWRVLAHSVRFVQGLIEQTAVDTWVEACRSDWRASKEFLASRFPDAWGNTARVEIAGGATHTVIHRIDDSELLAVAAVLQQVGYVPPSATPSPAPLVDAIVVDDVSDR